MALRGRERGEGRIGCVLSLLVFVVGLALAVKVLPFYLKHDDLITAAKEAAARAGVQPMEQIQESLVAKARALEIPEATKPGAIVLVRNGDDKLGNCSVTIQYTRKVDFFGITSFDISFHKHFVQPYMDAR